MKALSHFLVLLFFKFTLAGATDYYVDAVSGSNSSGDGSSGSPWKTITHA